MNLIMSLAGGLGLFLFGMNYLSDNIQKAAGARMRNILATITKNRFVGLIAGALFTAIIQSSSAATVMAVSFVNSGLMSLSRVSGIILGANIGTTITSQLVSFKLSAFAPALLLIGVIMATFFKKPMVKTIGGVILGFGALFLGIDMMSSAMKTIHEYPYIMAFFNSFDNKWLAILIGFLITSIVQSSSVTVSVILLMADQGLIGLSITLFFILGCNVGSCVTAMLASVNGNKDAKRAALIHFLFNLFGSALLVVLFLATDNIIPNLIYELSGRDIGRSVANAHSLIKICQVVVFFPFMGWIVKLTYLLVPGVDKEMEEFGLHYIDKDHIQPTMAVPVAIREIEEMSGLAIANLDTAMKSFFTNDITELELLHKNEVYIDYVTEQINDFLVKANQTELPYADSVRLGGVFHVVNDVERIGDYAMNIADIAEGKREHHIEYTEKGNGEIESMYLDVRNLYNLSMQMFSEGKKELMQEILKLEEAIDAKEVALQKKIVKRMTSGQVTPESGNAVADIVTALERVADHCVNIGFSILENDPEKEHEFEEMHLA